jgi:uncharacterized protein (TIGR02001 family)
MIEKGARFFRVPIGPLLRRRRLLENLAMTALRRTAHAIVVLLVISLGAVTPANAASNAGDGFEGTVTLSSDYEHQGVSESRGHPSVQGSGDYSYHGLYLGLGAAMVDYPDSNAWIETEYDAGFSRDIGDLSLDLGYSYYVYPGSTRSSHDNYGEFTLTANHPIGNVRLSGEGSYSPHYFGTSAREAYGSGGIEIPIARSALTLTGHVGHTWAAKAPIDLGSYSDWSAGVQRELGPFTLDMHYAKNTVNRDLCDNDYCGSRFVMSLTHNF